MPSITFAASSLTPLPAANQVWIWVAVGVAGWFAVAGLLTLILILLSRRPAADDEQGEARCEPPPQRESREP